MMAFGRSPTCNETAPVQLRFTLTCKSAAAHCAHIWAAAMQLFSTTGAWAQSTSSQTGEHQCAVEAAQTEGKHTTAYMGSLQPAARLAA